MAHFGGRRTRNRRLRPDTAPVRACRWRACGCTTASRSGDADPAHPWTWLGATPHLGMPRSASGRDGDVHPHPPLRCGVAPSQQSLREGCPADEVGYARHHRCGHRRSRCPGAQGAVPGPGREPYLDLIASHDPGLHAALRAWHHAWPAILVVLAGSFALSVWRVWFQPLFRPRRRGRLPEWPASPEDEAPSLVIGELHHPTVPRESERPSWLVIPEKGLYTGTLIVGAVGTGKTSGCMYPFARQILSWRADDPGRRAGALVLEVKGDFCHQVRGILEGRRARGRLPRNRARRVAPVEPARRSAARLLLARLRRRIPHQPALRQESRAVLATGVHEPRPVDRRTSPAPAGGLGHAPGHLPLHGGRGPSGPEDRTRPRRWPTGSLRWTPRSPTRT